MILENTDCRNCSIWELCFGGCPWNGWTIYGDIDRKDSSVCIGRKMIISHIKEYLIKEKKLQGKTTTD